MSMGEVIDLRTGRPASQAFEAPSGDTRDRPDWSPWAQRPDENGVMAHTPDPARYHMAPGGRVMLPRQADKYGASRGFSSAAAPLVIDPVNPATGEGGIRIDPRKVSLDDFSRATAHAAGNPIEAWRLAASAQQGGAAVAKVATMDRNLPDRRPVQSVLPPPPPPPDWSPGMAQPLPEAPTSQATALPLAWESMPAAPPALAPRAQAPAAQEDPRLRAALDTVMPTAPPHAAAPWAEEQRAVAAGVASAAATPQLMDHLLGRLVSLLQATPAPPPVPPTVYASAPPPPVPQEPRSYAEIDLPWLGVEARPPKVQVVFTLPHGVLRTRYHHVECDGRRLLLFTDTREDGDQFVPDLLERIQVRVPSLKLDVRAETTGFGFSVGCVDVVVLVVHTGDEVPETVAPGAVVAPDDVLREIEEAQASLLRPRIEI